MEPMREGIEETMIERLSPTAVFVDVGDFQIDTIGPGLFRVRVDGKEIECYSVRLDLAVEKSPTVRIVRPVGLA